MKKYGIHEYSKALKKAVPTLLAVSLRMPQRLQHFLERAKCSELFIICNNLFKKRTVSCPWYKLSREKHAKTKGVFCPSLLLADIDLVLSKLLNILKFSRQNTTGVSGHSDSDQQTV